MTPCFNGNISAIRTAWTDTANTYIYAYDAQNRLLSSKRLTDYAAHNSELFGYDEMGNLTSLKRFSGNRMIDDLDLDYGNIGAYWEETFQLYDETWEYVPASTAYSYGLTFPKYISGTESNGNISISFALCALLGVSITIDYQGQ